MTDTETEIQAVDLTAPSVTSKGLAHEGDGYTIEGSGYAIEGWDGITQEAT